MTTIVSTNIQLAFDKAYDDITLDDIKKALLETNVYDVKRAVYDACEEDIEVC